VEAETMPNAEQADLVPKGGAVKGLGLVGAVGRLLRAGYRFERVAGTSIQSKIPRPGPIGALSKASKQTTEGVGVCDLRSR
jgi:hypothetical protein